MHADGASWSLLMAGAQAVLTTLVFLLAIRRGEGGVSAGEMLLIAIAGAGVTGWLVADEPIVATACVVASAPDVSLLLYPVYFGVVNGALALFIHHRRGVLGLGPPGLWGCG